MRAKVVHYIGAFTTQTHCGITFSICAHTRNTQKVTCATCLAALAREAR